MTERQEKEATEQRSHKMLGSYIGYFIGKKDILANGERFVSTLRLLPTYRSCFVN